jgi:hypothetical protein
VSLLIAASEKMRGFLFLIVVIGATWAIDTYVFDGRYQYDAWQMAKYQGQKFNDEVHYWINRFGPSR